MYIARELRSVLHGLKDKKAVDTLLEKINVANNTYRQGQEIKVIIIAPPGLSLAIQPSIHVLVWQGLLYHDNFLVVMNNVSEQLMKVIDWDELVSRLIQHGQLDPKRAHLGLDLGVTGSHNSRPSPLSFGLPLARLHGIEGLTKGVWSVSVFEGMTEILERVINDNQFFGGLQIFEKNQARQSIGAGRISDHNRFEFIRVHISNKLKDHFDINNSKDPLFSPVITLVYWKMLPLYSLPQRCCATGTGRKVCDDSPLIYLLQDLSNFFSGISKECRHVSSRALRVLRNSSAVSDADWFMMDGDSQLLVNLTTKICALCDPLVCTHLVAVVLASIMLDGFSQCIATCLVSFVEKNTYVESVQVILDAIDKGLGNTNRSAVDRIIQSLLSIHARYYTSASANANVEHLLSELTDLFTSSIGSRNPNSWNATGLLGYAVLMGFFPVYLWNKAVLFPSLLIQDLIVQYCTPKPNGNSNMTKLWIKVSKAMQAHMDLTEVQAFRLCECFAVLKMGNTMEQRRFRCHLLFLYYCHPTFGYLYRVSLRGEHTLVCSPCCVVQHAAIEAGLTPLMYDFDDICALTGPYSPGDPQYKGFKYNLRLAWRSGGITEEPFDLVWADANEACCAFICAATATPSDLWDELHVCGRC